MIVINIGDKVVLQQASGEPLGELVVAECRYGAWCGPFAPAPAYDRVRKLFVEWTEMVNAQSFGVLRDVDKEIATLGITALRDCQQLPARDIQIVDEVDQINVSFRLVE